MDDDAPTAESLNWRAYLALTGEGNWTIQNIGTELANLLESPHPIDDHVRQELARALRRIDGEPGIRLIVAGHGGPKSFFAQAAVRRNWLEAGEAILAAKAAGVSDFIAVGEQFGLSERRAGHARRFYAAFVKWRDSPASARDRAFAAKMVNTDPDDYLKSRFVEMQLLSE